jgi:oxygen-independent coproporphyrinogen-3 oxidase
MDELIEKYNVAVPRYTSYPTVPNWNTADFSSDEYLALFESGLNRANREGLALYVHLPYCESLCTYCGCNTRLTVNHAVEEPYIDALEAEWKLYLDRFREKPVIKEIHLGGGTPTFFAPRQLKRLVTFLTKDSIIPDKASFSFEAHPANTTAEHLETLRELGFDRLSLGVQDFDPKVQRAINRKQSPEDVESVTEMARSLGYRSINFDLVYGLPFQTMEGVTHAVDQVVRMKPDRLAFYGYAHVPWKRPGQRAYDENDLPKGKEKLDLFIEGRKKLLKAGYRAIGFDHFALPSDSLYTAYETKRMHRNFMGFTDLRTACSLGLGVSAISDIEVAFAQNAKSVEAWFERLRAGQLPISKGHILTEQERIIRRHILNLTCKHRTSWAFGKPEEQAYMRSCLRNLEGAISDQMVEKGVDWVKLTERGKLFVRNVCAAFDKDYQSDIAMGKYSMGV